MRRNCSACGRLRPCLWLDGDPLCSGCAMAVEGGLLVLVPRAQTTAASSTAGDTLTCSEETTC